MRRWFLSYNSQDLALLQAFEVALRRKDAEAQIFFAPKTLRAGGYWLPEITNEIAAATAFVLLVGVKGLGPWQVTEYYEALDRRVKEANFPIVFVLLDGQSPRGCRFRASCTGLSLPIRPRKNASRWLSTRQPAAADSPAICGGTRHPIGALPP